MSEYWTCQDCGLDFYTAEDHQTCDGEVARAPDKIDHPAHYNRPGLPECIDLIEALNFGFHLGNTLKYLYRAGIKTSDNLEDAKKARWYLDRYISTRES